MQAHVSHVDETGRWRTPESKSTAGKRTLKLPEIGSVFAARVAGCGSAGWLFAGKSSSLPMKSVDNGNQKGRWNAPASASCSTTSGTLGGHLKTGQ
jgi:hypothetical protein